MKEFFEILSLYHELVLDKEFLLRGLGELLQIVTISKIAYFRSKTVIFAVFLGSNRSNVVRFRCKKATVLRK